MSAGPSLSTASIGVGMHDTISFGGATFNTDTILATVVAGMVVIGFGLYVRARSTYGVPHRAQLVWETLVVVTERQVEGTIGPTGRRIVPLAITLFAFILVSNWLELIPSGSPKALPSPTGDINLTVALAGLVILLAHAASLRARGLRGYLRHYLRPSPWLLPINLFQELTKPVTLALRLFGNVFAGTIVATLILELFPPHLALVPLLAWKLFAMFVAVVQAFIFALLTVLYFESALKPNEEGPSQGDVESNAATGLPAAARSAGSARDLSAPIPTKR